MDNVETKNENVVTTPVAEETKPETSTSEETKKTFTLEEVQALLNAKNYEKEARKNAEAELKTTKEKLAKMEGTDSVSKYNEDQFNALKLELENLKQEKADLQAKEETNLLKDELRKIKGIIPEAISDVVDKAVKRGFKKSELGIYLDSNGKTIDDFANDLKNNYSYYFGMSQNKNIIPDALQKQIDNAKKTGNTLGMLQEAYKSIDLRNLK